VKAIALVLRKDLRLNRLSIAVWLAVLVAEVVFTLSGLDVRQLDRGGFRPWDVGATVLNVAHLALLFVVVVGAVQADAPESPTAFWATRPLGRGQLLASKLLFAVVVIALPWLLANVAILIGRGIAPGDVARNLLDLLMVQAVAILSALVLGALTAQLPGAVFALVGLIGLAWVGSALMMLSPLPAVAERAFEAGRRPAADAVTGLVTLALAAAALAATYRRRPRTSTALVVVIVPLALGALFLWPWSFNRTPRPPLPTSVSMTAGDTARTGTAWVRRQRSRAGDPGGPTPKPGHRQLYQLSELIGDWSKWPVVGEAVLSGLPDDLRAWPVRVVSNVRSNQGQDEQVVIEPRSVDLSLGGEASVVVAGLGRVTSISSSRTAWIAAVDPRVLEGGSGADVTATTRVQLVVVRERLGARLPLRVGARWDDPSEHLALRAVAVDDTAGLDLVESLYRRRAAEPWGTGSELAMGGWDELGVGYYALYNRFRKELLRFRVGSPWPMSIPLAASGLQINRYHLQLTWPEADRWHAASMRRAWLHEAELVKIDEELVAVGERTLEATNLRVPPRTD
jgi:hypothetical protein